MKYIEKIRHEIMALYVLLFSRAFMFPIASGLIALIVIALIIWAVLR